MVVTGWCIFLIGLAALVGLLTINDVPHDAANVVLVIAAIVSSFLAGFLVASD